ncbi:unnamed protein product [Rhizoctonia solani]|nr:unnamed protein product [Rhizoctonia solani]
MERVALQGALKTNRLLDEMRQGFAIRIDGLLQRLDLNEHRLDGIDVHLGEVGHHLAGIDGRMEGTGSTSYRARTDIVTHPCPHSLVVIKEYGLQTVNECMIHIRNNAEQSVRKLLRDLVKKHGNRLEARYYLGDGSPMNLRIEIDEALGSAVFDYEGTGPEIRGNLLEAESRKPWVIPTVLIPTLAISR